LILWLYGKVNCHLGREVFLEDQTMGEQRLVYLNGRHIDLSHSGEFLDFHGSELSQHVFNHIEDDQAGYALHQILFARHTGTIYLFEISF